MSLIYLDTHIFMYAIGAEHPFKDPSERLMRKVLDNEIKAIINTEVLQEVLYRYSAIGKPKIGFQLFDTLLGTFPIVWPVVREDLIEARRLQEKYAVKTRDAIHAATMKRNGVHELYSFDTDFDRIPGIRRMVPQ